MKHIIELALNIGISGNEVEAFKNKMFDDSRDKALKRKSLTMFVGQIVKMGARHEQIVNAVNADNDELMHLIWD